MKKKMAGATFLLAGVFCFSLCGCGRQAPDEHAAHDYGEWVTVTQPTCTKQGSKQRVCKCGEKQTETIPATEHKGGSYLSDGQYHWKSCSVCGETYQKGEHDFEGSACRVCDLQKQIPVVYSFELNAEGDGYIITGVSDGDYFPALPAEHEGKSVTEIADEVFANTDIAELTIPDSVVTIGELAFWNTPKLKYVEVPATVVTVKSSAFYASGVQSIAILGSVAKWGKYGSSASVFSHCENLKTATIGKDASANARYALDECPNFETYIVEEGNPNYVALNGVIYSTDLKTVLDCPIGRQSVTVAEGTEKVGDRAFASCKKLTTVVLPESLLEIGEAAFISFGITEISIPDSVTYLKKQSFSSCTALKKVMIGKGWKSYYSNPFVGCTALNEIEISPENARFASVNGAIVTKDGYKEGMMYTGGKVLYRANLAGEIPSGVTYINSDALYDCKGAEEITIPASVREITISAFARCTNLKSVTFADTQGWTVTKSGSSYPAAAETIDVTNKADNATNLTDTYKNYTWRKG